MTHHDYWHGEPDLVEAYRRLDELNQERANFNCWLQGLYIYRGIGNLAPILRTNLSKTPAKAESYGSVIPITEREVESKKIAEAKANQDEIFARLMAMCEKE